MSTTILEHNVIYQTAGIKKNTHGLLSISGTNLLIIPSDSDNKVAFDLLSSISIARTKSTAERPSFKAKLKYTNPEDKNIEAFVLLEFVNPPGTILNSSTDDYLTCPAAVASSKFYDIVNQAIATRQQQIHSQQQPSLTLKTEQQSTPAIKTDGTISQPPTPLSSTPVTRPIQTPTTRTGQTPMTPSVAAALLATPRPQTHIKIPTDSQRQHIFHSRPKIQAAYRQLVEIPNRLTREEFWSLYQDALSELSVEKQLHAASLSRPRDLAPEDFIDIPASQLSINFPLVHRIFTKFPEVLRAFTDNVMSGKMTEDDFWLSTRQQIDALLSSTSTGMFLAAKEANEIDTKQSVATGLNKLRTTAIHNSLAKSLYLVDTKDTTTSSGLNTPTSTTQHTFNSNIPSQIPSQTLSQTTSHHKPQVSLEELEKITPSFGSGALKDAASHLEAVDNYEKLQQYEDSLAVQGYNLRADDEESLAWGRVFEETDIDVRTNKTATASDREQKLARSNLIQHLNKHSTLLTAAVASTNNTMYKLKQTPLIIKQEKDKEHDREREKEKERERENEKERGKSNVGGTSVDGGGRIEQHKTSINENQVPLQPSTMTSTMPTTVAISAETRDGSCSSSATTTSASTAAISSILSTIPVSPNSNTSVFASLTSTELSPAEFKVKLQDTKNKIVATLSSLQTNSSSNGGNASSSNAEATGPGGISTKVDGKDIAGNTHTKNNNNTSTLPPNLSSISLLSSVDKIAKRYLENVQEFHQKKRLKLLGLSDTDTDTDTTTTAIAANTSTSITANTIKLESSDSKVKMELQQSSTNEEKISSLDSKSTSKDTEAEEAEYYTGNIDILSLKNKSQLDDILQEAKVKTYHISCKNTTLHKIQKHHKCIQKATIAQKEIISDPRNPQNIRNPPQRALPKNMQSATITTISKVDMDTLSDVRDTITSSVSIVDAFAELFPEDAQSQTQSHETIKQEYNTIKGYFNDANTIIQTLGTLSSDFSTITTPFTPSIVASFATMCQITDTYSNQGVVASSLRNLHDKSSSGISSGANVSVGGNVGSGGISSTPTLFNPNAQNQQAAGTYGISLGSSIGGPNTGAQKQNAERQMLAQMDSLQAKNKVRQLSQLSVELSRHYWSTTDELTNQFRASLGQNRQAVVATIRPEKVHIVHGRIIDLIKLIDFTRTTWNQAQKSTYSAYLPPILSMLQTIVDHYNRLFPRRNVV